MWDYGFVKTPPDSRDALPPEPYRLRDFSVGRATGRDPLESYSWEELRGLIYERPMTLR
ncbi:MAG: hypothetical protein OXH97_02780 [Chloroflexota bacterium]|nr:hypothetical protein [Chloroflexota bacterium]